MELGDLFSFDKKIAPSIIKPIYWIGMLLIVFVNIIYFFFGFGRLFTVGFFTGVWEMLASIVSIFAAGSGRYCSCVFAVSRSLRRPKIVVPNAPSRASA